MQTVQVITEEFAYERLSLEWLEVIDVFACTNEDDGTSGGRHTDRRQQEQKVNMHKIE